MKYSCTSIPHKYLVWYSLSLSEHASSDLLQYIGSSSVFSSECKLDALSSIFSSSKNIIVVSSFLLPVQIVVPEDIVEWPDGFEVIEHDLSDVIES